MRLVGVLLGLVLWAGTAQSQIFGRTTPTEAAALAAAEHDHTAYTLPPDKLAKAEALKHTRYFFYFVDAAWGVLMLVLILQLRVAARMRDLANNLSRNKWTQGWVFLLQLLLVTTLLALPLEIYQQHVSLAYGLSVQGWGSWVLDREKSLGVDLALEFPAVMLLFVFVRKYPRRWWLPASLSVMALTVAGVFWTPYVIDPLFNKFEPLSQSNPALVEQLERVAAKGKGVNIPPERMFLMKASDKVTTLNAYVTGFGSSKRVVVWDTSIAKGNTDEVLMIFGHEMGHYVLGHVARGMLFSFPLTLAAFFVGFYAFQFLLRRCGARWGIPAQDDWGALVIMVLVVTVLGFLSEPIQNSFSRQIEHDADVYGQEVVHGIVPDPQATGTATEQLLGENSFTAPDPSPFVTFWAGSHPPTWLRAAFAKHYDPWAAGAEPKYFTK